MTDRKPRAILFDLDDTIIAFESVSSDTWRAICEIYAPKVGGVSSVQFHEAIIESRNRFWRDPERHRRGRFDIEAARKDVVSGALRQLGIENAALAEEIAISYSSEHERAIKPFPGALETLSKLQNSGVRLAIITLGASEAQRGKIERFGLAKYFDYILIEGEFGVGKPDKRVYLHTLEQLSVQPSEAWMIGDNLELDVEEPQKLGIKGVWIDHSGRGVPRNSAIRPDRIVRSISELA